MLGADGLIYQDLEDLIKAVGQKGKTAVDRFDTSVFNGEYVYRRRQRPAYAECDCGAKAYRSRPPPYWRHAPSADTGARLRDAGAVTFSAPLARLRALKKYR